MLSCFEGCTKLTAATLKCNYNPAVLYKDKEGNEVKAFKDVFKGCTSLKNNSVKVPSAQVAAYKAGAGTMGADENWFAAE